jgi:rubrerythrin
MKTLDSCSWTTLVRKLLYLYELPNAHTLADSPPSKEVWKKRVNRVVNSMCYDALYKEAGEKKTLKYLNLEACTPGSVHPAWKCGTDPLEVTMATVKVLLLVQRYPLSGTHCAGKLQQKDCPICKGPPKTLEHFLLHCPNLQEVREPHILKISNLAEEFYYQPHNDSDRVQVLMDPSVLFWAPSEVREDLEELSRRMCYALHIRRSVILGTRSSKIGANNLHLNHSGEEPGHRNFTRGSPTPEEAVSTSDGVGRVNVYQLSWPFCRHI